MAQIILGGSVGVPGSVAVLGNFNVVFASDANHTLSPTEFSNKFLNVTGTISVQRDLIAPLNQGQEFVVQNNTAGGHTIRIIGSSGTGVIIPSNGTLSVVCDGTNYMQTSGSGTFTAAGDLSGTSSSQTVIGINGHLVNFGPYPITASSPTNGQILEFISGAWNAVTLSASGVSWTGDLGPGAGVTSSSDGVQYVTSISGAQGGGTPGRIQLYGNNFHILNFVNSNFTIDQQQSISAFLTGHNGHDGYNILITAQTGQIGDIGLISGNGGSVIISSGFGGSGLSTTPGAVGSIQINTADASSALLLNPNAATIQANTSVNITMADTSSFVQLGSNQVIMSSGTGSTSGTTLVQSNNDGYISFMQMTPDVISEGDNLTQINVSSPPGKLAKIELSANGVEQFSIATNGVKLLQLAPISGTGLIGINSSGLLSFVSAPAYGSVLADVNDTVSAGGGFVNFTITSSPSNAITQGASGFTIINSGTYRYDFQVRGTPSTLSPPSSVSFALSVNSFIQLQTQFASDVQTTTLGAGLTEVVTGSGIISLSAGNIVKLRNRTNENADTVTLVSLVTGGGTATINAMLTLQQIA